MKIKYLISIVFVFAMVTFTMLLLKSPQKTNENKFFNQNTVSRNGLEKQGRALMKKGDFQAALNKFHEALDSEMINQEWQKGSAKGQIVKILIASGQYEAALREWQWFLDAGKGNAFAQLKEDEILALSEYKKTGDKTAVFKYIDRLTRQFAQILPPNGASESYVADLLKLYDVIGEQDKAIELLNQSMSYLYIVNPEKDVPATSEEAYKYVTEKGETTPHRPDWLFYKKIWAHLKIKEAFEKDKTEGFKGCLQANASLENPCLSNAVKALIQSDYFPW